MAENIGGKNLKEVINVVSCEPKVSPTLPRSMEPKNVETNLKATQKQHQIEYFVVKVILIQILIAKGCEGS